MNAISHSTCGPHEDNDIIFGPVKDFGWQISSTPLYHKFSEALIFLLTSLAHVLSQHSVTRKKNFMSRTSTAPISTRARPASARMTLRVPAPAPQMRVPATCAG